MGCIDAQFAEDVFAVGRDGVDAGKTFGSNLLGGLALGDGFYNLHLRGGQDAGRFFLLLLLGDDGFEGTLTEIACVAFDSIQGVAQLAEWAVLEHHAELMGRLYDTAYELRREIIAEEYPVRQAEAFGNNE